MNMSQELKEECHRAILDRITDPGDREAMQHVLLAIEGAATYAVAREVAGLSQGQAVRVLNGVRGDTAWTRERLAAIEAGDSAPLPGEIDEMKEAYAVEGFCGATAPGPGPKPPAGL